ncbi:NRDE family protein [Marinobacter sp.]|uniref:NRDE family protein n=1 Tax=Marinobacter sp. TaxID=50741 RepID=UPI00356501CD
MCLILFALDQHPEFPLVLAANRDEFYDRPTTPMHWWPDNQCLAGRDDRSGGTWLAVSRDAAVTAVTNVREGSGEPGRLTRGKLPLLALDQPADELTQHLADHGDLYAGFNLVRLAGGKGWYYSNRDAHPGRSLHRGTYGLSNHLLQSPWPKLVRLREQLRATLAGCDPQDPEALHEALLGPLGDSTPAPDHLLPDTGIGLDQERFLSSPFIASEFYGTRASTVVTVALSGEVRVTEQQWGRGGVAGERQHFNWQQAPAGEH